MLQRIVHALFFKAQLLGIAHVPQAAPAAAQAVFAFRLSAFGRERYRFECAAVHRRGRDLRYNDAPGLPHYRFRHEYSPAEDACNAAAVRAVRLDHSFKYLVFL